jgi:transcriptional regulator with XRE-family HTH domain
MPRTLTPGQRAAVGAAVARRGELGLTQKQLAAAAGVSERTIGMFEMGRTWPRADTLAQIERLGLGWPVGYLNEYALRYQNHDHTPMIDRDIADIMASNLHPDLKLRLIDRLRVIVNDKEAERLYAAAERAAAWRDELRDIPGEGEDKRDSA